jgi:hypothetical protein
MDSYYCIFWSGGHILEASWGTMRYIRQRGHELATREPKKEVRIICSLTREGKCEILGHWRPDGYFVSSFGDIERLSPDGQSMETVKKHS